MIRKSCIISDGLKITRKIRQHCTEENKPKPCYWIRKEEQFIP